MEVGPRLSFTTAWSANAVSVCQACALPDVTRIERSRRYLLSVGPDAAPLEHSQLDAFAALVSKHDILLFAECDTSHISIPHIASLLQVWHGYKNVESISCSSVLFTVSLNETYAVEYSVS